MKQPTQDWREEFNKEVPGYSMNIIGDNDHPTVEMPIMCQREDARLFVEAKKTEWEQSAITKTKEEIREGLDGIDNFIAYRADRYGGEWKEAIDGLRETIDDLLTSKELKD